VFTQVVDVAFDTARRLAGLTVLVNDHPAFRVDWMPFGGHERSGLGIGGIGRSRGFAIEVATRAADGIAVQVPCARRIEHGSLVAVRVVG
jgi:acyl-CoA reductase-like NAD-dependent aldehyde dehydrogenase